MWSLPLVGLEEEKWCDWNGEAKSEVWRGHGETCEVT